MNRIQKRLLLLFLALLGFAPLMPEAKAQFYSASVNTLALPALTLQPEVSMTINRNWSLHGDFSFNGWRIEKFRLQHLMFRPQIRYWFSESYRGHFIGMHSLFAGYHIGIPDLHAYKYEGVAFGGGLDWGYSLPIATRWNLEFQLGGSLLWLHYDRSKCLTCGDYIATDKKVTVLPSKAAISLVYLF